jgi:hypothetical protein
MDFAQPLKSMDASTEFAQPLKSVDVSIHSSIPDA